jgi:hypothetical protein
MDLARAVGKFANTGIEYWDKAVPGWTSTGSYGTLQVFDRFITEREFGQKKRILVVPVEQKLASSATVVRLSGSEESFIVEKFNEDVRFGELYAYVYLLHEAPLYVNVCKTSTTTLASGAKVTSGETVLESTWVDISRYSSNASRAFEETDYSVLNMTFPSDCVVDTDCYLKTASGDRYNVDEIAASLDVIFARGKRVGM